MRDRLALATFVSLLALFGWQGLTGDDGRLRAEQDHTITLSLSRELVDTGDYHPDFVYPLPAVVFKLALGGLGTNASSLVWMALMLAAALACVQALARLAPTPAGRSRYAAPLLGALAIVYCVRWDFRAVNSNTVFLAAALWGFERVSRGRAVAGGALLAVSVALKLYSAPLVALLAWMRSWRALAWSVAWLGALFVVVPALWFGPLEAFELTGRWIERLLGSGSGVGEGRVTAYNVSLLRALGALLGAAEDPSRAALWGARLLALAFAASVVAWLARFPVPEGSAVSSSRTLVGIGLVLVAALLLSPITQPHHGVMLWPLATVIAAAALDSSAPTRSRIAAASLLVAVPVGFAIVPSGSGKAIAMSAASLLLGAATLAGLGERERSPS